MGYRMRLWNFFHKNLLATELKPKNQFWGHIFPKISGSIGPIVSRKKKWCWLMCELTPTMWISWKSVQNCDLFRDSNNYYKLKI